MADSPIIPETRKWKFTVDSSEAAESSRLLNRIVLSDALKYLRHALHSSPPVLAALHPLVQLLLVGGQVKDALDEIEYCCSLSSALLPVRLRASLLQQFESNNKSVLSTCLEFFLKKDPTCCDSLEKLILLHQNDDYSHESLLEMIALHLDGTTAECNIWRVCLVFPEDFSV